MSTARSGSRSFWLSHCAVAGDGRRDLRGVRGGLSYQHHPGGHVQPLGQRDQVGECQPDGGWQCRCRAGETQAEARRKAARAAMEIRETKGFGGPRDVEQERVRDDDEEDVDERSVSDHSLAWLNAQGYIGSGASGMGYVRK